MCAETLPPWWRSALVAPKTWEALDLQGDRLVTAGGVSVARVEKGVVRFPIAAPDAGIEAYRAIGGAQFFERAGTAFAMSTLDTPVYHAYLERFRPDRCADIVVDVGGGDGRNARPYLESGHCRVVVIDAVAEALVRFRDRIAAEHPDWLDRLMLVEADARNLPLAGGVAERVFAIEALYYLNEDYELGIAECARVIAPGGKLLVSERDYEGGLVMRLLYAGIPGLLQSALVRDLWDGSPVNPVRSRCFTESEILATVEGAGLAIDSVSGTSLLSLLLGWMRGSGRLAAGDESHLPAVDALLSALGTGGRLRRCHVVVARKPINGSTRFEREA